MISIPDHPDIQKMEREGVPASKPILCPICGHEADTFFKDMYGDVVGCMDCIQQVDAWEEVSDGDVYYGNETSDF